MKLQKQFNLMNGKSISIGHKSPQVLHASPKDVHPTSNHFAHSMFPMALAFGDGTYLAGWDRTATGEWGSLLLLNAEQKKAAESLFNKFCTAPEWFGYSSIKLGDAGSEILRNGKRCKSRKPKRLIWVWSIFLRCPKQKKNSLLLNHHLNLRLILWQRNAGLNGWLPPSSSRFCIARCPSPGMDCGQSGYHRTS